jgi:hypothetical protein
LISAAKVEASWPGIEQRMPKQGFSASNLRQSMMLLVHDRSKGKKSLEGMHHHHNNNHHHQHHYFYNYMCIYIYI